MATNNQQIVPLAEDVQRAISGNVRDEQDAYYLMDRMESAAMDPTVALQAVTGMKVDSLVYEFRVGGATVSGITVKGAKALASRRGGFDVEAPIFTQETMIIEDRNGDLMDVPAVRAVVRVRDKQTDVTFVGTVVEPKVMVTRDGRQRIDSHADRKAASKAERNAILDHFTAVTDVIESFVAEARKKNEVFVSGEASAEAERVSQQIAIQKAKREAKRKAPIGKTESGIFRSFVEQTEADGGLTAGKLSADLLEFMGRQWPGLKLAEVPADASPVLYDWLNATRAKLGLEPVGITAAEKAFEEPASKPETGEDDDLDAQADEYFEGETKSDKLNI